MPTAVVGKIVNKPVINVLPIDLSMMRSRTPQPTARGFPSPPGPDCHAILRAAEFLRDLVAREVVVLQHVSGTVTVADLLTEGCSACNVCRAQLPLSGYSRSGQSCPSSV